MSLPDWWKKFWSKLSPKPWDCWEWKGSLRKDGYGRFSFNGEAALAHRVSYLTLIGPIEKGLVVDHLCRNRKCVNPDHLEIVTHKVNILRGQGNAAKNARMDRCPKGHLFTPENVYICSRLKRKCKTCTKRTAKETYYKKTGVSRND